MNSGSRNISKSSLTSQKVRQFGISIFSEMTALARQHGAVNLSQGFPDFHSPGWVRETAKAAIDQDLNQYAPSTGIQSLREAIATKQNAFYGVKYNADLEITVTSGATEAIFASMLALLNSGDEVVVLEPSYDSYVPAISMAGAQPLFIHLEPPGWNFDPEALERRITSRTRAILINTPHNPTGKVFTREELQQIADVCLKHDLLAITDEVYENLVFTPHKHFSIGAFPGMRERTVCISSTSKTFSLTGWKVGYVCAPARLSEAIRKIHQFIVFSVPTPLQHAMAQALNEAPQRNYYAEFLCEYDARRHFLIKILCDAGFNPQTTQGTYFILSDCKHLGMDSDVAAAKFLTAKVGVACIPVSAFYSKTPAHQFIRFCFAKSQQTLEAAAIRLSKLAS